MKNKPLIQFINASTILTLIGFGVTATWRTSEQSTQLKFVLEQIYQQAEQSKEQTKEIQTLSNSVSVLSSEVKHFMERADGN